ncbi:MAG: hypothetical protein ACTHW1_06750 [Ancrocorticia sp.]|uniref:hypothetical protein n=1 Tax=Ancrocorticia sp. TaxID=2593684 RepID=UPI003F917E4D
MLTTRKVTTVLLPGDQGWMSELMPRDVGQDCCSPAIKAGWPAEISGEQLVKD